MKKKLLLSLCLVSLLACGNLQAEDSLDDDLGGFDTEEVVDETSDDLAGFGDDSLVVQDEILSTPQEEKIFTLSGDLAFKTAYGYKKHKVDGIDYSGFNQAQTSLYLQLDSKLSDNWKLRVSGDMFYDAIYDLHTNTNYNKDITDAYKTQLRLDDTYIQGSITNNFDIKIGRQIVVWGKSDSIRVTDVINPLDNRQPAMTDIEDLRLSVGMLKLDYYVGMWNISAMIIPENRIFIEAPARSEFFPVDNIFPTAPNPFTELKDPNTSWDNIQYAMAINGVFSGWDLSFYTANVLDQKWHIDSKTKKRVVGNIKMVGSAINIATGSWLLKSEIAYINGIRYNSTKDEKNRLDTLVGFDYMGIKDTVLSLEIASRHIFNYEKQMGEITTQPDYIQKNEMQTAIRATRSFINDTINTTALLSMFGSSWENGGFLRVSVEYEIMDALSTNFGVVDYRDGDKPLMKAIKDNDRIFADITYSF